MLDLLVIVLAKMSTS